MCHNNKIIIAQAAGFCKGVHAAVSGLRKLAEANRGGVCTLGKIIHNNDVQAEFARLGVELINGINEANGRVVAITTHGVSPQVYDCFIKEGIAYADFICPDVKAIHRKVAAAFAEGRQIILAGNPNHPETIGTNGYADDSAIILEDDGFENALFKDGVKYVMFSQTTFEAEMLERIATQLKKFCVDVEFHNTICPATEARQAAARKLSSEVDAMLVIGSNESANTLALYKISKENCRNTFLIENLSNIDKNMLKILRRSDRIGITAGASTPPGIIKEVYDFMDNELTPGANPPEQGNFEQMLNEQIVVVKNGDFVKGTVISVQNNEVVVNIGYKSDGIIERGHFCNDPNADVASMVKPGDELEVLVVRVNDGDGVVYLSRRRAEERKGIAEVEQAFKDGTPLRGKITKTSKGGVEATINGVRAFVPASQVSNFHVKDLETLVGQEFDFNIIKYERGKRGGVVAGRRELAAKQATEAKSAALEKLEVGMQVSGIVRRITDFGAFVDIGGIDGMVHISQLSYSRIKKVTEVLNEGDEIVVAVLDIDKESGKVKLSYKDLLKDPWDDIFDKYPVGKIVNGKVVRFARFGAFIELEPGIDGLCHISQIAYERVNKPDDFLTIGETVEVKVLGFDSEKREINLSVREAGEPPVSYEEDAEYPVDEGIAAEATEDKAAEEAEA